MKKPPRKSKPTKKNMVKQLVLGIAIAGIIYFILYLIVAVLPMLALGGYIPNNAEKQAAPLIASLESLGGTKVCDNGDNGHGPDNSEPWYRVYYSVPYSPALVKNVKDKISQDGYALHTKNNEIDPLQSPLNPDGSLVTNDVDEDGVNSILYVGGNKNDNTLSLGIYHNTVPYECGVEYTQFGYGNPAAISEGKAVVRIDLSLPDPQ